MSKNYTVTEGYVYSPSKNFPKAFYFLSRQMNVLVMHLFFNLLTNVSELDHKESWVPKNWCFRVVVLLLMLKTLKGSMDSKEIKPVSPKGNQPWIFTGRTDAEAEAPTLWPPDAKSWLIGKDPDSGKDWGQEKGTTEDKMVGWYHWLNGHEFKQTPGDSERWAGKPGMLQSMGLQSLTQLSDWTATKSHVGSKWLFCFFNFC